MMYEELSCVVCQKSISSDQPSSQLTAKGCDGINRASTARHSNINALPGQHVHQNCRQVYTNLHYIEQSNRKRLGDLPSSNDKPSLRSSVGLFDYASHCLFCGQGDPREGRNPDLKLIPIRTLDFQESVLQVCDKRNDEWAKTVQGRIKAVHDLHAADAVYHKTCSNNFRTNKDIPVKFQQHDDNTSVKRMKRGRPHHVMQAEAFKDVMHNFEHNDDEQTTIKDLIDNMAEFLSDSNVPPYGHTYMKDQIQKKFGDKVIITEINGKPNVVTMWSNATSILQDFHSQPKTANPQQEKDNIIKTAAKLLKNDIKMIQQQSDMYPTCAEMDSVEMACTFLPKSLQLFIGDVFTGVDSDRKMASIGQSMVQATRRRVLLAPLQLGLGVQLHYHFGSKFLIDTLHKHGFTCSYSEVSKFERSAAVKEGTDIPNISSDNFIQYIADNVDHNLRTIDGHNTFHGMGIMATVTPGTASTTSVPRVTVTNEDIALIGRVNIHHFVSAVEGLCPMQYDKLVEYDTEYHTRVDLLWDISLSIKSPRPAWSGLMQMINKTGNHPGKSSMLFLPMLDIEPGDITCIYSTMMYVSEHAARNNVTPILTFDQPLWLKALMIQESSTNDSVIRSIVLRLGGFHIQMSYCTLEQWAT